MERKERRGEWERIESGRDEWGGGDVEVLDEEEDDDVSGDVMELEDEGCGGCCVVVVLVAPLVLVTPPPLLLLLLLLDAPTPLPPALVFASADSLSLSNSS